MAARIGVRVVKGAAVVLLLIATAAVAAEPLPSFVANADRSVAIVLPQEILTAESVRKQLDSGLTTIFLLTVRSRERRGAGRIEIRYDMWDEVWIVRRIEFDGRADVQRLPGREALAKWWRAPTRLLVAADNRIPLSVTMVVLPFSAAEGEDARDWVAKSGAVAVAAGGTGGIVDALIGTTISARPLTTYQWKTELTIR